MSKTFNPNQLRAYREASEYIAVLNSIEVQLENIGDAICCDYDENITLTKCIFEKAIPAINEVCNTLKEFRKWASEHSDNDSIFFNGEDEE